MNRKYSPEMCKRPLRMLAETRPEYPSLMSAVRHVAGLIGMSPETLRLWQRRYEIDAGVKPRVTTDAADVDPASVRPRPSSSGRDPAHAGATIHTNGDPADAR
ncbi:hypothetical protein [Agromyces bracchium]|uniref:Transposase n=1 Tax=Agromyces bracchium TaxID=88376 RepID=A0A6I3M2P8_9MICO|nr:hypothetical protein [Agromyces bracchium]MTH67111.1 hypothetical protein [Agromyces bracchium]